MLPVTFCILLSAVAAQAEGLPAATEQVIVVTSDSWNSSKGSLQRYAKQNGHWVRIGTAFSVVLGRNGMGWGRGIRDWTQRGCEEKGLAPGPVGENTAKNDGSSVPVPVSSQARRKDPVKREGDGRSPAGVFALPFAFGQPARNIRYPYRRMEAVHRCVDDCRSKYYNRIIDRRTSDQDYGSSEPMKLASGLYRYGIFVAHNPRSIPGAGSCIFMHIRDPSGVATSGCTAMSEQNLLALIDWLDPRKNPLLVQMPRKCLKRWYPELYSGEEEAERTKRTRGNRAAPAH